MSKTARGRRWTGWLTRKPSILRPFPVLRCEELEVRENPSTTFIWTGTVDTSWSKSGNWQGGVAPTGSLLNGGQDLVFGAAGTRLNSVNDITGSPTFNSLIFQTGGYNLSGAPISLGLNTAGSGMINVNDGAIGNTLGIDTKLTAPGGTNVQTIFVGAAGATLTISGQLSGTTGATLTKDGSGTLTLANDNSGFTGRIKVNDSAGILQITDARALGDSFADTTVGTNASLRILDPVAGTFTGTINEPLRINGPGVVNDGALRQNAPRTVTWAGPIVMDSNATIGAAAGAVLAITGIVSDTGTGRDLTKEGQGEVRLNSPSGDTYRGLTTVNDGILTAGTATALGNQSTTPPGAGTVSSGTIVNQTLTKVGQLRLAAINGTGFTILNEFLTLNGPGPGGAATPGSLANGVGDNLWAGPVVLGSPAPDGKNVVIGAAAGTNLTISGVVSSPNGAFALTKDGPGRLILNNANTYTGLTTVAAGVLNIRDSNALGATVFAGAAAGTSVSAGAALELDVESAYPTQPQTDTQGTPAVTRDLGDDSVTHDPNKLFISEPLSIIGRGVNNTGALRSVSGINTYAANIFLNGPVNSQDAIGVDPDTRPGHPLPSAAYFTQDYSLTVGVTTGVVPLIGNGTIFSSVTPAPNSGLGDPIGDFVDLVKRGAGHLILPIANVYTGATRVEQGWVTIQNKNSLGRNYLPGEVPAPAAAPLPAFPFQPRSLTVQPGTFVSAGAAVHVKPLVAGGTLTIAENITLQGIGPVLAYPFISQKGALLNLDGNNTWSGSVGYIGQAGVGVEGVIPGSNSELTVTGSTTDGAIAYSFTATGAQAEQAFLVDTGGATSGVINITYNFYTITDRLTVYYPPRGPGQVQLLDTGYINNPTGPVNLTIPFGPGTGTTIEVVMNEGGNPNPGTVWDLPRVAVTVGGGLVKLGDKRLNLQGDGTYSGATEIREGVLRSQNHTALGQKSSGTLAGQEVYTQTDTIVSSGAVLQLDQSLNTNNGGISAGLSVFNEKLTLNAAGQQIGTAGGAGTFSLNFRGQTSAPIPYNVPATSAAGTPPTASLQNTINALMSEFRTVQVNGTAGDTFTLTFRGAMTNPIAYDAPPGMVANELNLLPTIGGVGGGVVVTSAPSGPGTLYTINFGVGTLATTNIVSTDFSAAPSAGTPTVTAADLLDGLGFAATVSLNGGNANGGLYTVVFGSALDADVPTLTATPFGGAEVTISGGNAPLTSLAFDHTWRGPVTVAAGTRINTGTNTRITILGNIDDAVSATPSHLTKRGGGELLLGGNNSYRGTTLIDAGVLTVASSTGLGSPAGGTDVTKGAQLQIQGSLTIAGEALAIEGQGTAAPPTFAEQWAGLGGPTNNGAAPKNLPTSARVTGIAVDPRDAEVIYVSTAGGGAWKTKDGGRTWLTLFDDQSGIDAKAVLYGAQIIVNQANPSILWYATGTADGAPVGQGYSPYGGLRQQDNYAGTGVYTSTNYGATWTLMAGPGGSNPIFGQAVTKMIQDPISGKIVVATSNMNLLNVSPTAFAGIYRFDGAATGWFSLTNTVSDARQSTTVFGQAPYTDPTTTPPGFGTPKTPGPDDDWRIAFPRNLVLQDPDPYNGSRNSLVTGTPAPATWSDIAIDPFTGVMYAALGESNQQWFTGAPEQNQAVLNAVYRLANPSTATAAPFNRPIWSINQVGATLDSRGTTAFPTAPFSTSNTGSPTQGLPLPGTSPGSGLGDGVAPPPIQAYPNNAPNMQIPQPGRNGYIKLIEGLDSVTVPNRIVVYAVTTYPEWHYLRGQFQDEQLSLNGGSTWQTVNSAFPTAPFGTAVFNQGISVLTDPPNAFRMQNLVPGLGRYDNAMILDPTVLDASTAYLGGLNGLYKTTNYGATWTQLNNPAMNATGNGPASQYHVLYLDAGNRLLTGSDGGIWRYDGTSYVDLNGNMAATMLNSADPHPTSLSQVVAGATDTGTQQFANSQAWTRMDDTAGTQGGVVRYDPSDPRYIYAVRDGLLRMFDPTVGPTGAWVTLRNVSAPTPPVQGALAPVLNPNNNPVNDPFIGVGSAVGIATEIGNINQFPLVVDPQSPTQAGRRLLVGGTGGLVQSIDAGKTFTNLNAPVQPTVIAAAQFQGPYVLDPAFSTVLDKQSNVYDPDTIYVTDGTTLALTKNGGVSWTARTPAYEQVYQIGFAGVFAGFGLSGVNVAQLVPTSTGATNAVVATTQNGGVTPSGAFNNETQTVTVTLNPNGGGGTFTLTGFPGLAAQTFPFNVTPQAMENQINAAYLALVPTSFNRVVVRGTQLSKITDIVVDPSNRDVAYATVSYPNGLVRNRVFRTTDGGLNWVSINGVGAGSLPTLATFALEIDPRTGTLYLGNDQGVYALPGAQTAAPATLAWTRFGSNLPRVQVTDLTLNQTTNTLVVGSHGRSAYQVFVTNFQANSGVVREVSGTSTWTGPVTLKGDTVLGAAGSQNIQNGISPASLNFVGAIGDQTPPGGPFTVTKRGLGTIIFSGTNTYSGQTLVEQGVLQVNNPRALGGNPAVPGDTGLNTVVNAGAVLQLRTDLDSEPVTINGDGIAFNSHFGGALQNVSNDNTYTGTLTLNTPRTTIGATSGTSLTIGSKPGVLTGTGRVIEAGPNFSWDKEGTGTLALASSNTFGGLALVRQGALQVQDGGALGSAAGATEVLDGAALEIARNAVTRAATVVPLEPLFVSGTGINGTGALRNVRGIRDLGIDRDPAIGEPANGYLRHGVGDTDPNGANDNTWAGPITLTIDPNTFPPTNPSTVVAFGVSDRRDSLTIDTDINQQPTPPAVPGQPATVPAQGTAAAPASMGLAKVGAGRLILNKPNTAANAFTGVVTVADGSLRIRDKDALGGFVSSAVQQINIVGTVGTFQPRFNGVTGGTITLTAGPPATTLAGLVGAVQTALNGMSTLGGAGNVLVSGTQSTNGFILTVTFKGALANTDQPLILPVNPSAGLNVFITTVQKGGTGTTVANGANLEFDGAAAGGLTVPELITLNGDGLPAGVTVTAVPLDPPAVGTLYTVSFVGSLENVDQSPIVAIGTNGAIPTVATVQDGTAALSEVQTIRVEGGAGQFTLTFNGQTTAPLPYGASADQVQQALDQLLSVGGVGRSGSLRQYTGDNTTTGLITLGSDASIGAAANTTLTLAAGFQDPTPLPIALVTPVPAARLRKAGPGTVLVPTANAYAGRTVVDDGILRATAPLALGVNRTEVQTLTSFTAANNYTLTFNGQTTGTIAGNAPAATVQVALLSLSTVRHPEVQAVEVTGSTTGSFTLTYNGVATNPIPASPTAAVPGLITTELNAILGAGAVAGVTTQAISGGNRYTITFGGPVNFQDLVPLIAFGLNGTTAAMSNVPIVGSVPQDGLNGSVTVTALGTLPVGAAAGYTIAFGDGAAVPGYSSVGLGNVNVPPLVVAMVPAATVPSAFVTTTQDGQGAETQTLSENAITGTFTLRFNGATSPPLPFNASDNQVRQALNALPTLGIAEVQRVQVLGTTGTFTLSFRGSAPVTLPVGAPALAVQAAINGLMTVNGGGGGGGVGGVAGNVSVTATTVPDGIVYQVTFGGTLAATDVPPIVAAPGGAGVLTSVATEQDGGGVSVSRAAVAGGFIYTVTFAGAGRNNANQAQIVATGSNGSFFTNLTSNDGPEGTSVTAGATLQLGANTVTTETVTLNGDGFNGLGALNSSGGASTWSGPIFLGSDASIGTAAAGDSLRLTGPITDGVANNPNPFGVDVLGPGTVTYAGTVDNRYFGTTAVLGGTLLLSQAGPSGEASGLALRGPLVVGGGAGPATVTETTSDQIEDVLPVTVLERGTFNLNANLKDVIDTLTVNGGVTNAATVNVNGGAKLTTTGVTMLGGTINVGAAAQVVLNGNVTATSLIGGGAAILGPGVLNLNGADRLLTVSEGPQAVDLLVTAGLTGVAAVPERLVKDGLGRVEFAPTVAQTVPVDVRQGDLQIDPTAPLGPTQLLGGTISGTGTVASLGVAGAPANGVVAPGVNWSGNPFGVLRSAGAVVLGPLSTLSVNLRNSNAPGQPVAGTDYDQLQVSGPVTLGGAVLSGTFGPGIKIGDTFTLITATGGVSGRLAQPFGPNVTFINGRKFSVDYSNPNQVVLTNVLAKANIGLTSSVNPSTVGQQVTFTAQVTAENGAASIPNGSTVTFTINGVAQAPVALDVNGRATLVRTFSTGGSYTVAATFNGDPAGAIFGTATTSLIQGVGVPVLDALQATALFISPTPASVGTQDTITFSTSVRGDSAAVTWKIEVFAGATATGTPVRTYTGSGTADPLPIAAVWDGRNSGGTVVADGQYTVKASFSDTTGNSGASTVSVFVDSTVPSATGLTTTTSVIAPGTASTVPTTTILSSTIGDANPDRYTVTIRDAGGTVVRTIVGSFTPGPAQQVDVAWDGRTTGGAIVPNGTYTASITVQDLAGNTTTPATTATITVLTTPPAVNLVSSSPTIYGQDAVFTATVTSPNPSIAGLLQGVMVQFMSGATVLGEAPLQLSGGQYRATLTVTNLPANAAGYAVKAVFPGTTTFLPNTSNTITHQVLPATLTVTADSLAKVYGDALPPLSFTVVGLVNNDPQTSVLVGGPTTAATASSSVGTYTVDQGSITLISPNYSLNYVPGTLTVTPAPLTVRADDQTRVYGDANPPLTLTVSGLVNGDTPAAVLTGVPTTAATPTSSVGLYTIGKGSVAANTNYALTFFNGTLRVTPAALTVTPDNLTKVYGAAVPPRTFTVSGLKNSDTAAQVLGGSLSTTATAASRVGSYPITRGSLSVTNNNYTLTVLSGAVVTVTPAPLSVKADNQSKVYGSANPTLTVTATGLVNGDTTSSALSGTPATPATAASGVGTYAIARGSLASNGDYALSFSPGTLTVTPAPLTVAVDNKSRKTGGPNPAFTATFQGLVNGDTAAVVQNLNLTTPATTASPAGTYPINSATAPVAANYSVNVVPGVLTVSDDGTSPPPPPPPPPPGTVRVATAVGTGSGSPARVNLYAPNGSLLSQVTPFGAGFTGGARSASGDVTGDGVADIVVGTGPGSATLVKVYDGKTFQEVFSYAPFEASFTGGVFVTTGDMNGDGVADIAITPDQGGGPRVIVLAGGNTFQFPLVANFFGIKDDAFRGGARAAIGDLNGDGFGDIAVAAGFQGGPRVSVYDGKAMTNGRQEANLFGDFFIFGGSDAQTLRNGVFLAAGDLNGDGFADLIAGGGPGGGPRVLAVDGRSLVQNGSANPVTLANFFGGDPNSRGGIRVTAKDLDNDGKAEVIVGSGDNAGSLVTVYPGKGLSPTAQPQASQAFNAFDDGLNGVFVG